MTWPQNTYLPSYLPTYLCTSISEQLPFLKLPSFQIMYDTMGSKWLREYANIREYADAEADENLIHINHI